MDAVVYIPVRREYVDEIKSRCTGYRKAAHWRYSGAENYNGEEGLLMAVTDWRNDKAGL